MNSLNERRAIFVYEAARLHAMALHCPVIPKPWAARRDGFRRQFLELIAGLCAGKEFSNFREAHDSWVNQYQKMGWKYGEIYDPKKRTHPDLVPYDELDPKEQVKDEVFVRLVQIAKDAIW